MKIVNKECKQITTKREVIELIDSSNNVIGSCQLLALNEKLSIWSFEIKKEYRRNGYACLFLQQIEEMAKKRGHSTLCLYVLNDNFKAINLYKKCGFSLIDLSSKMKNYSPSRYMEKTIRK